jgi:hypothetical protein
MGTGNPGGFSHRAGGLPVHEGTGSDEYDNKQDEPDSLGCPEEYRKGFKG